MASDLLGIAEDDVRQGVENGMYKGYKVVTPAGEVIRVTLTSLDIILGEVKDRREESAHQVSTLDTKASFVLGAASLFVATVTGFQAVLATHTIKHTLCTFAHSPCISFTVAGIARIPEAAIGIIYVAILYSALRAYGIRPYKAFEPLRLQQYLGHPEQDTKIALIRGIVAGHDADKKQINDKVTWTQRAVGFFIAGGIALLTMIALSIVH